MGLIAIPVRMHGCTLYVCARVYDNVCVCVCVLYMYVHVCMITVCVCVCVLYMYVHVCMITCVCFMCVLVLSKCLQTLNVAHLVELFELLM